MQEWEYKTIRQEITGLFSMKFNKDELDNELNKAGADGWELSKTVPMRWTLSTRPMDEIS